VWRGGRKKEKRRSRKEEKEEEVVVVNEVDGKKGGLRLFWSLAVLDLVVGS
jgi:hypothetical protein